MASVLFLYPTLRDAAARVPRATSIPSMLIGAVYSMTFFTLGMEFSAFGSFAACTMWSLIAAFRAPDDRSLFEHTPLPPATEWRARLTERVGGDGDASQAHGAAADSDLDAVSNSD
jgi:hypothetical protein